MTARLYLIHFDEPLSHARHYLGSTDNLARRLEEHASGEGARILDELNQRGIGWSLVRVLAPTSFMTHRQIESLLKRHANSPRLCPLCSEQASEASPPGTIDVPFRPFTKEASNAN